MMAQVKVEAQAQVKPKPKLKFKLKFKLNLKFKLKLKPEPRIRQICSSKLNCNAAQSVWQRDTMRCTVMYYEVTRCERMRHNEGVSFDRVSMDFDKDGYSSSFHPIFRPSCLLFLPSYDCAVL